MRWSAKNKRFSQKELTEKLAALKVQQHLEQPDFTAIKTLEKEIDRWLEQEDVKWKQMAKRAWHKGGDQNNKFFHVCASQRRKHNRIHKIKNNQGEMVSSQEDTGVIFSNHL